MMYICSIEYYPNCRAHEGGSYSHIEFFNTRLELLDWLILHKDDYKIMEVYGSINQDKIADIRYEYSIHNVSRIIYNSTDPLGASLHTIDDGHGKLVWEQRWKQER